MRAGAAPAPSRRRGVRRALLILAGAASLATSPMPMLQLDGEVPVLPEAERRLAADFVGPAGPDARACGPEHWTADTWSGGWRAVRITATGIQAASVAADGPTWRDVEAWARGLAQGRDACGQPRTERVLLLADAGAPVGAADPLPAAFAAAGIADVRWYALVQAERAGAAAPPHRAGAPALLVLPRGAGWEGVGAGAAAWSDTDALLAALPGAPPHALQLGVAPSARWGDALPLLRALGRADQAPALHRVDAREAAAPTGPAGLQASLGGRWVMPDEPLSVVEVVLGVEPPPR